MKKKFLFLLLLFVVSGLFAEEIYYKKYKNGEISLTKENEIFTLKTDEIKANGFNYITIIEIKDVDSAMELIYVLETNCKNGNYYDFVDQIYTDSDDLKYIDSSYYFKNKNLVQEDRYRLE